MIQARPRLGARLGALLDAIPPHGAVADIGSGHGVLAAALAARGQRVIATERTPWRAEALRADLSRHGAAAVEVRGGEGMTPIAPGEVEVAVIAGMGGRRVAGILTGAAWLPPTLVLQPIQEPTAVEAWIAGRGLLAEAATVLERGREYRLFVVAG